MSLSTEGGGGRGEGLLLKEGGRGSRTDIVEFVLIFCPELLEKFVTKSIIVSCTIITRTINTGTIILSFTNHLIQLN